MRSAKAEAASPKADRTPSGRGPSGDVRSAANIRIGRESCRAMYLIVWLGGAVGSPATGPTITSIKSRRSSLVVAKGPSVE
jgi:hypothetical protein